MTNESSEALSTQLALEEEARHLRFSGPCDPFVQPIPAPVLRRHPLVTRRLPTQSFNNGFAPTILIVDDHEDGRDMLVEYFLARAYPAIAVGDPRLAATYCRDVAPAVVLVDLSLPTLDAACQLICTIKKQVDRGVAPYIVGLNGWGFVQQAAPAIAAGCSVVIAKPLDLGLLVAAVTIGLAANVGGCSAV